MRKNTIQALIAGVAIGATFAIFPSCGKVPNGPIKCQKSNCDGCCSSIDGLCKTGLSIESCGSGGETCSQCTSGQMCSMGDCLSTGNPSDGGTGGSGGGGGGTTGGGSGGGPTGGGQPGGCDSTNCATGCCTAAGVCITQTTPSRCGTGGASCSMCTAGNTCVTGVCTPCNGCIDINTGRCEAGLSNTQCGKNGGFCQACDQVSNQTCQGGACFGGSSCNGTNCTGCCDGATCKLPTEFTNAQCGQGAAGAACTTCFGGSTCDALDAGACVGSGAGGGTGGGFTGFDGGFDLCSLFGMPCQPNYCCGVDAIIGFFPTCYAPGDVCGAAGTTCGASAQCQ